MPKLHAYLTFDGTCAEAMRFYEKTLGGTINSTFTFGESPMADHVPAGYGERIMHMSMTLDGSTLMASDGMPGQPYEGMKGISLSLNYTSVEEAKAIFTALAEGGKVTMPFEKTFWAEGFGMVVDRFGTPWMVDVEGPKK